MNLPTYNVDAKAEGAWLGWQTALGAVIVGLLTTYADMDAELAGTIAVFGAATSRIAIGHFLPSAKAEP